MEHCCGCREPLEEVRQRLDMILAKLEQKQRSNPAHVFFDNQEFLQIMNISKRTALQWRLEKIIGYSQVNNKIYYRLADILTLLDRHYKPSKK